MAISSTLADSGARWVLTTSRIYGTLGITYSAGHTLNLAETWDSPATILLQNQQAPHDTSHGGSMAGVGGVQRVRRGECALLRANPALSSIAVLPGKYTLPFSSRSPPPQNHAPKTCLQ